MLKQNLCEFDSWYQKTFINIRAKMSMSHGWWGMNSRTNWYTMCNQATCEL